MLKLNTLATWLEELTHWKRPWCWERLKAEGEGDDRGWDGWLASRTWWTWVWVNSGSWWWTGRPGVLQFMGSQRVGHDWVTELNWTDVHFYVELTPRSRNAGPSIIYTFSFIDTVKQFWKWLYKYIFLSTVWAFRFYIYLICPVFFIFAILVGMGWHLILVFICISLMTNEV